MTNGTAREKCPHCGEALEHHEALGYRRARIVHLVGHAIEAALRNTRHRFGVGVPPIVGMQHDRLWGVAEACDEDTWEAAAYWAHDRIFDSVDSLGIMLYDGQHDRAATEALMWLKSKYPSVFEDTVLRFKCPKCDKDLQVATGEDKGWKAVTCEECAWSLEVSWEAGEKKLVGSTALDFLCPVCGVNQQAEDTHFNLWSTWDSAQRVSCLKEGCPALHDLQWTGEHVSVEKTYVPQRVECLKCGNTFTFELKEDEGGEDVECRKCRSELWVYWSEWEIRDVEISSA